MKRIGMLVLALALLFSMAACGDGGDTASPSPSEAATSEAPTSEAATSEAATSEADGGSIKVDVFIYKFADTYIASVRDAMQGFFTAAGIDAQFYDANENQSTQTDQITTALTEGTDLLIVNIVTTGSEDAAQNIVDLAKEEDVPVIFFNREVADEVVNSYDKCCFVGTDANEAGVMQGELAFEILSEDFETYDLNGDGEISYIMFKGELGNAEAEGRTQYSVETADEMLEEAGLGTLTYYDAANPDLYQFCNWDSAAAQEAMATALNTNPMDRDNPIELVLANNDDMALGAIEALNEIGYNTGSGDSIPVLGVDATSAAREAIDSGKMAGSIMQDAEGMAECIVHLAQNVEGGKDVFSDLGSFSANVDEGVNKVRIPYGKVS